MLHRYIDVRRGGKEGRGLFATEDIKKGEIVWTLDKEEKIISKEERDTLPDETRRFAFQYKNGFIVVHDGSEFMNHSCDPNLWWNGDNTLSAVQDIKKGEEITYDYSTADVGSWIAEWICNCGSKDCRKKISGNDCLAKDFQEKYKGHLPSWAQEYINASINNLSSN